MHSESKHHRKWFSGDYYRAPLKGSAFIQPFRQTFIRQGNLPFVLKQIRQLIPNLRECEALEIGPGQHPVITHLPFKKRVCIEQSEGIAKNYAGNIIVGELGRLPIRKHFGLSVVMEVFTHVKPSERIPALAELAEKSNALMIVDRPRVSVEKIKAGDYLADSFVHINHSNWEAKLARQRLVNFEEFRNYLVKRGWEVTLIPKGRYMVMTAKRK